jgi:hypothetical protein
LEPVVIEWARRRGREVYYNSKSHSDPADFELKIGNGVIVGRFDAIFDDRVLIDVKTCNANSFANLLEKKVPQSWLVQLNVYFFGLKLGSKRDDIKEVIQSLEKIGIFAVHKDSGRDLELVFDPSIDVFKGALEKAVKVFSADAFEELEVDRQECKWCEFRETYCKAVDLWR